ncbi:hypothetical protein E2C01_031201 [Portunus trituberculatus]|uniref:Uncharacterized protein n=1 Tax=Portunus trituberculatus TaxID=210409 RepID=A0A5B7ESV1_PORTR|nr:hypothetical protein [Portunus trituberculatus]
MKTREPCNVVTPGHCQITERPLNLNDNPSKNQEDSKDKDTTRDGTVHHSDQRELRRCHSLPPPPPPPSPKTNTRQH